MTYDPNQPREPEGSETGGQWSGDGSIAGAAARKAAGLNVPISQRIVFAEASDDSYKAMGCRKPSDKELAAFKDSIDKLPPEISNLYQGKYAPLVLAINDEDDWYGRQEGNWTILGRESVYGENCARHEFIHYITNQGVIGKNMSSYAQRWYFKHALQTQGTDNFKVEDLGMTLGMYNKNTSDWIKNVKDAENGLRITEEMATDKVNTTVNFLSGLGLWQK